MSTLLPGQKVRYLPQPEWGIGHLVNLEEDGAKAQVLFPTRDDGPVMVSTRGGGLVAVPLPMGTPVRTHKGRTGVVTEEVEGGRGLRRYVLKFDDGGDDELPEPELRALPPRPDLLSMLKEGRATDSKNFILRRTALELDDQRRNDAMGALLASRVMVKPHQVGVVQRVLSARRPRFVLADEVGLGKTIEAGMAFTALKLSGLVRRCLVVAPAHLTVQWLVELFHKFNQLFTLLDAERIESSYEEAPDVTPWARFELVITSLEQLQRNEEARYDAGNPDAFWDLVIIDEAHHLKGEKAFEAAAALAKNCWGLLLLTATPMQLDPAEYQALLTLIDDQTAPSVEEFKARLSKQEEVTTAVRALIDGKPSSAEVAALAKLFPADGVLEAEKEPAALLGHVAETYSLSNALIRNRRALVGGFSARVLHRHPVALTKEEEQAREAVLATLAKDGAVRGAVLTGLLRRLESSPAAFLAAVANTKALAALEVKLPDKDAKFSVFARVLKEVWAKEPQAKVLVFTEARETLEALQKRLSTERVEALAYHGDLPLVERDRQVARFRDPDGPKVLVCTEVGGEGRNFQFAHHLVNYDLPWSPSTMEQRIGRLDRIGQMKDVDIHVFDVQGTLSADVLTVLADAVGVFGETIGGLDAVLEEVEGEIAALALEAPAKRKSYVKALSQRVALARAQVKRAYDPLLDLKSFDKPAVLELVARAKKRSQMEDEDDDDEASLEDGLWAVARDLDERLEETVTELAARIGLGVDTDQQVEAFQCAFTFGHTLNVEALPGLDITRERTVLGTFWRDTAVELEEIEYFATGHPIVEALFGFLRDGPYGKNGCRFVEVKGPMRARGLELLFHITPPEPADLSAGAKVPSRQLSRFLDSMLLHVAVKVNTDGQPKAEASLLEVLRDKPGRSLKGDEVRVAFPELPVFVDPAVKVGTEAAHALLAHRAAAAKKAIEHERDAAVQRLGLSLAHQGVAKAKVEAALQRERAHYAALLEALAKTTVSLDSACAFIVNR